MEKYSISLFLMEQAKQCLDLAIIARKESNIDEEVRLGINLHLLLGVTLEGVINEIGEQLLDKWTWTELEKASTPLKWRIISGMKKVFEPSKEPLQTIIKLQKIRNKIAHPKPENMDGKVIMKSNDGKIKRNVKGEDKLPEDGCTFFLGIGKLLDEFNVNKSLSHYIKALKAIIEIKELFKIEYRLDWSDSMYKAVASVEINKFEECH